MKTIRYIAALAIVMALAGCYDDKGNYDYHDVNEVTVNGIPEAVEIDQFETLSIKPDLEGSIGGKDLSLYEYEWKIGNKVISTEKDLNYEVSNSQGSYTLLYTVTDKETQVKTFFTTKLVVNYSTSADGILVVSTQDGLADLSYLRLDKQDAEFSPMFYNKNNDEPLGTHPRQLYQTYVDGSASFVKKYGGRGIKIICDQGLIQLSNITLENKGKIDKEFLLEHGELYPVPDYSSYVPEHINSIVTQWRRTPYGSIFNDESVYLIAGGGIYVIFYERSWTPEIRYSNFKGSEEQNCKFSPMMFETGRTPTPSKGKNLNAGWDCTYTQCVFDERQGKFYAFDSGDLTDIDSNSSFPGYKAFYGSDTYQVGFCFSAIENNGQVKFATFDTSEEENTIAAVDAAVAQPTSRFFMLRNTPYVYFNTTKGIYKYNILNVASGIQPAESDKIMSLADLGYGDDAVITDICLHRNEKKMLVAVSRYGNDEDGKGSELKGDIIEISLEGANPSILKKHTAVCGANPLVIYKYRTFARNDEFMVD